MYREIGSAASMKRKLAKTGNTDRTPVDEIGRGRSIDRQSARGRCADVEGLAESLG